MALALQDTLTVGDLLVGLGTLALACFTAWLGFETRISARAAREAVEAAEEPFVIATFTPSLADMYLRAHEEPGNGKPPPIAIHRATDNAGAFVRLRLWNIGDGPAIAMSVRLTDAAEESLLGPLYQDYPVSAGGAADIEIPSPRWLSEESVGVLTIEYVRASGLRYRTSSKVSLGERIVECRTYVRSRL